MPEALFILSAITTAASVDQSRTASRENKRANQRQQQQQDAKVARERRKQVREAQSARSETIASAVAAGGVGALGSSSVSQATGSVGTQLASNLSFLDTQQQLAGEESIFRQKAADARGRADTLSAVSSVSSGAASSGIFD